MVRRALLLCLAALVLAAPALASEERPTLADLEDEIICPTCHTVLALSSSPIADRMRQFIRARIAAGDTKSEIKEKLVAQFGEEVLAAPPKQGFNLIAWVLPFAGIALAGAVVGMLAWRWTKAGRRGAGTAGGDSGPSRLRELDPDLERRLDEELARFDG